MSREVWGYLVEFDTAEDVVAAVRRLRAAGYTALDAHTPFPVEGLAEVLGFDDERVDMAHVAAGVVVAVLALAVIVWANALSYPLNIGGRPLVSWPSFVLPVFEVATLGATVAGFGAMVLLNRLPDHAHPLLAMETFHLASDSRFFVSVAARDPLFSATRTRAFLDGLDPVRVEEVPA